MPQLVLQRRPKNINKASLWVEGFVVAQAPAVATYLNQRYLAPFGAPIGHISILIAEGVAGLWADAKELTKASKRVTQMAVAACSMLFLWFRLQTQSACYCLEPREHRQAARAQNEAHRELLACDQVSST
jgi:hypothetical protein